MSLWSNAAARNSACTDLAAGFSEMGLPNTATKIVTLGREITRASRPADLLNPLNDAVSEFELEWGSSQHKRDVRDSLHDLLLYYLRGRGNPTDQSIIGTIIPNLEARKRAELILGKLVNLLSGHADLESLWLQTCLIYMVALEGVFDQTLRVLFFLSKLAEGTPVSYANAHSNTILALQTEFNNLHIIANPSPLFDGYSNRLRNSIAHSNMTYDSIANTMTFEDRDPSTGNVTWGPTTLTYPQLKDDYYGKIENVNVYLSALFGLIRARDLALATGVP